MGKRKGKGGKPSSGSAGSASSGQQTLMNNLKISKIPETMLEDEKIEKGKENAESSNPNPAQNLGNSVQENQQSDKTPSENKKEGPEIDENQSSTPKASTDPIKDDQPDAALSPKPLNDQTYLPPQVNPGYGYSRDYASLPLDYETSEYQLWQHAPLPWQLFEPKFSFIKFLNENNYFAKNYQPDIPQSSSKNVTTNFAEAKNHQEETSAEEIYENQKKKMKVDHNPPNVEDKKEGINHEDDGKGKNVSSEEKKENEAVDNEKMIPPASSSGVPSDLEEKFPSVDPSDENTPWTERMKELPSWEWDDFSFP